MVVLVRALPTWNHSRSCGYYWVAADRKDHRDRHAFLRAFVPAFRSAAGFLRTAPAGFVVLAATGCLAFATAGFLTLAMGGFLALVAAGFRAFATAGFFASTTTLTGAGNSGLGDFRVRWWPWCSDWMRVASSSVRS